MNEDGTCISTNDSPVFVCECCGGMLRVLFYEAGDEIQCSCCGTLMTKTSYALSDDEGYFMYGRSKEAFSFQDAVFRDYVKDSPLFDDNIMNKRLKKRKKRMR